MMMPLRSAIDAPEKHGYDLELIEAGKKEERELFPAWIIGVVAFVFLYRIFLMVRFPLTGDEAYYWLWGKHLALGYHDHPPLIGWLIGLTTFFSNGIFWVRLPALLCSVGAALFFYLFARDFLGSSRKAGFALMLFLLLPILAIAEVALIPDSPLIFSWAFCLWGGWKSLRDGRYWPVTGLALGLAVLSKLMSVFLFASFALFFILNRKGRFWLTQKNFWLGGLVCLLVSLPFWIWNFQHGFENFTFQAQDHLGKAAVPAIPSFLAYLGFQSVCVSPILFLLFVPVIWGLVRKSLSGDARAQFLLSFFLPIQGFFLLTSFRISAAEEIHWALAGYLALLVACVDMEGWNRFKRWSLVNCAVLSLIFCTIFAFPSLAAYAIQPLGKIFPQAKISRFLSDKDYGELLGYKGLSYLVKARVAQMSDPVFLLTDSYDFSSDLTYYTGREADTFLVSGQGAQYGRWEHYQNLVGENAIWVARFPISDDLREKGILQKAFQRIGPEEQVHVKDGPVVRTFYMNILYDLRNPTPLCAYFPRIR